MAQTMHILRGTKVLRNPKIGLFRTLTIHAFILTHICIVDPSILINWTSPFPVIGVPGVPFHFDSISNRYSC